MTITLNESMTKDQAVALAETDWWKCKTAREIVAFQLFTPILCMDFGDFHAAVEATLGHPVWTHEFGLNIEGLRREFLGDGPSPTFEDIMGMIPAEKLIVVCVDVDPA